jgi:hypothetical protein
MKVLRIKNELNKHRDLTGIPYEAEAVAPTTSEESGTYTY